MENREFARNLEGRTKKFAVEIIRLCSGLPNSPEGKVIRNQLTRSGTSIGVNYREANRARSRADFRSKIGICASEASETGYWLEIIGEVGWVSIDSLEGLKRECDELLAIFSSIGKNLSSGPNS